MQSGTRRAALQVITEVWTRKEQKRRKASVVVGRREMVQANERLWIKAKEAWGTTVLVKSNTSACFSFYIQISSFIYHNCEYIKISLLIKNIWQFKWQTLKHTNLLSFFYIHKIYIPWSQMGKLYKMDIFSENLLSISY